MTDYKIQGASFEEKAYETEEGQPQSAFDEIMLEEMALPQKFPLSLKSLVILAAVGVVLALVAVAYFYFKPMSITEAVDEMFVDEPWGDYYEMGPTEPPPLFAYSTYEADKLRAVGYTSREIEEFELQEIVDIQPLIDKQITARQDSFLDMYRAFMREARESGNEQYIYALSNTYLGLPPQVFLEEDERLDYSTYTENVDYWKMPLQGWQPTIKLRLVNDAVIYMHVTPSRYEELRDSGNMNIRYDYIYYKGVKSVTNVSEVVQ